MDFNNAFLNGVVEEEIYIEHPEGFQTFSKETHVCKLKRALYGLKQEPRAWYTCINYFLYGFGFTKSEEDSILY